MPLHYALALACALSVLIDVTAVLKEAVVPLLLCFRAGAAPKMTREAKSSATVSVNR